MVTVGSIWGETLRFLRNNLGPIAVWCAVMVGMGLLSMAVMAPFYQAQLAAAQSGNQQVPNIGGFFVMLLLMMLGLVVLWAAVFRAVLFPDQKGFFYLRVGMDEVRLLGTVLVVFVGGYIAMVVVGVVASLIIVMIGRLLGGITGAGVAGVLSVLAIFCLGIWAVVRVSPCGPLTIYRRQVVIGPAWRLTRGAFWRLLGAYLLLGVLLFVAYLIVFAVQIGSSGMDMRNPTAAMQAISAMQNASIATRAVNALITGVVGGVGLALHAGMTAVVTRQLLGITDNDLEDVFA